MTTKLTPHTTATARAMRTWRRGMAPAVTPMTLKSDWTFWSEPVRSASWSTSAACAALRAVADHGTLAAAADALHLTPSAVSQQLAALEREVGHRCSSRPGAACGSTPAAQVLLGHADALFAQLERLEGDLAAQDAAPRGEVRVGGFPTALAGLLAPGRAAAARGRAGGQAARPGGRDAARRWRAASRRDLDVILGMECSAAPRPGDARFHREELLGDTLDAVLPVDHPLAGRARIDLADARGGGLGRAAGRLVVRRGAPRRLPGRGLHAAGRAPRGRLAGGDGARGRRAGHLARAAARADRAAAGRRDHPADRRPAEAPRVHGLPRRRRVRAGDPRACSTRSADSARRQIPLVRARMTGASSSTWTGCSWTPSRPGTQARSDVVAAHGGAWKDSATRDMLGHELEGVVASTSSTSWASELTPEEVNDAVVEAMLAGYTGALPLLPGAREAVDAARATTSRSASRPPRTAPVIDARARDDGRHRRVRGHGLLRGGRARQARARRLPRGARRLGVDPRGAAIEDSENGIGSAHAAGHARDRDPQPALPARRRRARAGRRDRCRTSTR